MPRAPILTAPTFRRLCEARDRLSELRADAPSVSEVAAALQRSPTQLIRDFRAVFGATPHAFRTQLRIERAKLLLASAELSVTEVCVALGFSSLGSFSELFTRRVGASPLHYRRRLRRLYPAPQARSLALHPGCFALLGQLPAGAFRNFREAPTPSEVVRAGEPTGGTA